MCRHIARIGRRLPCRLVSIVIQRIFDTSIHCTCFAGYALQLVSNLSCEKSLSFSSHWKRSRSPSSCLKEITFPPFVSIAIPRNSLNPSTAFLSSVTRTALEDVIGLISMFPGDKGCLSTSQHKVTKFLLWGLTTMSLLTHLSKASNSLSISFENLSALTLFMFKYYCSNQRGCLVPSFCCMFEV